MELRSLALRTDLIFDRFQGEVRDRGDFIAVRTPRHPDYRWGNRLIMPSPPGAGALDQWCALYERAIGPRTQVGFMTFTWDDITGNAGEIAPFLDAGFTLVTHTALTTTAVAPPPYLSDAFTVRPFASDTDWAQYADVHHVDDYRYGTPEEMHAFTLGQRDEMRAMAEAGLGLRFGAFEGERLIAELGIYWDGDIARFNNVATRKEARRQGACRTLVYHASNYVLRNTACRTLVIIAKAGGPAARLYEALGFKPTEQLCKIEWPA